MMNIEVNQHEPIDKPAIRSIIDELVLFTIDK